MQEVSKASKKRFKIGNQSDPILLLTWLLNSLSSGLRPAKSTLILDCFQGELYLDSQIPKRDRETLEDVKIFDDSEG